MTLRCKCGGAVEIQGGTDPAHADDGFFEVYECRVCGRTGGFEDNPVTGSYTTGCLVKDGGSL